MTTLEFPRYLLPTADDTAVTGRFVRQPEITTRLDAIEHRQRMTLARDQAFAVAILCLVLLFAIGLAGG